MFVRPPCYLLVLYSCRYVYCTGQAITHELKFWSAPPLFLEDEDIFQKSATMVASEIAVEVQPREPIFEKCPHLREKGGVLTLKTPRGVCAYPYSRY